MCVLLAHVCLSICDTFCTMQPDHTVSMVCGISKFKIGPPEGREGQEQREREREEEEVGVAAERIFKEGVSTVVLSLPTC